MCTLGLHFIVSWHKENRINKFSGVAEACSEGILVGGDSGSKKMAQSQLQWGGGSVCVWGRQLCEQIDFFQLFMYSHSPPPSVRRRVHTADTANVMLSERRHKRNWKKNFRCLFAVRGGNISADGRDRAFRPSILYYETWCRRNKKYRSGRRQFIFNNEPEILLAPRRHASMCYFLRRLMISGGSFRHV